MPNLIEFDLIELFFVAQELDLIEQIQFNRWQHTISNENLSNSLVLIEVDLIEVFLERIVRLNRGIGLECSHNTSVIWFSFCIFRNL